MTQTPDWLRQAVGVDGGGIDRTLGNRTGSTRTSDKHSAVLMLFSGHTLGQAEVLLTHRCPSMRSHSGQVAFPGGHLDPGETAVDAALREAHEETGFDASTATVLDVWDPVRIRLTGKAVTPVLAHWHSPSVLGVASPAETDDVFTAPVTQLLDPAHRITVGAGQWTGPAFWHRGYLIWGFTGSVLDGLFAHAGWEEAWDRDTVHDLQTALASSRNNERADH